jgi:serine/threonine protein kinase
LILLQDGVAKIGDVGMAKIMSDGYLTRDGALGTMAWAAPELLLGEKCAPQQPRRATCLTHVNMLERCTPLIC